MFALLGAALIAVGCALWDWRAGVIAVGVIILADTITWQR